MPWKMPFEAPRIAHVLPQVRALIIEGNYDEALQLSLDASRDAGFPPGTRNHSLVPAFTMGIELPNNGAITNYLRTVNYQSGEISVYWDDNRGSWQRSVFVSRPDNLLVQELSAPEGALLDARITLTSSPPSPGRGGLNDLGDQPSLRYSRDFTPERLVIVGRFDPSEGNNGYVAITTVNLDGGTATIEDGQLVIEDAASALLLSRVEWYKNYDQDVVDDLIGEMENMDVDYQSLLQRNTAAQSAIFDRVSLEFGTTERENAMSGEELLADQKLHIGYNTTLLSKLFDTSRYWLMLESGDFPPIHGHLNVNINLQVSGGVMANLPESMDAFYRWIEGNLADARINARNIFGARGARSRYTPISRPECCTTSTTYGRTITGFLPVGGLTARFGITTWPLAMKSSWPIA